MKKLKKNINILQFLTNEAVFAATELMNNTVKYSSIKEHLDNLEYSIYQADLSIYQLECKDIKGEADPSDPLLRDLETAKHAKEKAILLLRSFYAVPLLKILIECTKIFKLKCLKKIKVIFEGYGWILKFPDKSDVASHSASYGHEHGLLESFKMKQDERDITGYLSPKEVVERLKKNFKRFLIKKGGKK